MVFKYETHLHTSEVSKCAKEDGKSMAEAFCREGYAGIIVTDHFFNGNTLISRDLDWETKVNWFCKGYENAKAAGDSLGLDVFFGWEYNYKGTEFLTYGLDKNWLLKNPDLLSWSLPEYVYMVRKSGGFIVHAHPFREADYIKEIRLFPELVDAVEVVNTHNKAPLFNSKALEFAKEHGLPQTGGTDAHSINPEKFGGMVFERRLEDVKDFISAVKSGEGVVL